MLTAAEDRSYEAKQCKITRDQKRALVDFISEHFTYRKGLFKLKDDTQNKEELWEQMTAQLNEMGSRKTTIGWRKTCADLRMHLKKKLIDGKELSTEDLDFALFYGMNLDGKNVSAVCYERLSSEQKARMIDLVCENFTFNTVSSKLEPIEGSPMSWEDISAELNSLGTCVKTVSGWKKCWSDLKCDCSKKFEHFTLPMRLTPGELKIATLYNFNNYDYQVAEVKEIDMVDEEALEEEHLEYMEEKVSSSDYVHELEEVDIVEPRSLKSGNEPTIILKSHSPDLEVRQDLYQIEEVVEPRREETHPAGVEKLLEEQRRTNDLLEKLLEQQKVTSDTQLEILNELRNNSFFVMTNPNRNNPPLS